MSSAAALADWSFVCDTFMGQINTGDLVMLLVVRYDARAAAAGASVSVSVPQRYARFSRVRWGDHHRFLGLVSSGGLQITDKIAV